MYYTKLKNPKEYRQQLKGQMDDFTSFQWGAYNMYDEFGMFIINEKEGGLKMYNGPSFSNQYTKAQFSSEGNFLSGINFNVQTIEFTVGMYYFTIAEYRQMLKILSPYEVNNLTFDFNPEWHYQVKLKNIADSPKHIVGQRQLSRYGNDKFKPLDTNTFTEYYYYTELKLSFEIQGTPCLYAQPYEWGTANATNSKSVWQLKDIPNNYHEGDQIIRSDLDFPFDVLIPIQPLPGIDDPVRITIKHKKDSILEPELLMDCILANLTQTMAEKEDPETAQIIKQPADTFYIHYYSDTGVVLYNIGNSTDTLLTLMSSGSNGKRLVEKLEVHRFMFAKDENLLENNIEIELTNAVFGPSKAAPNIEINSMARTNIA